ncbi:PRC-barrel domain-containing protein [Microvirga splendida]|uniref:PRC-barrel domain-containing protein n=1 Tax=Microvirga splendida TaxID=2795727 RepID=A0ABS0Y4Z4_9HYPH|nr:PRC-barrel domain-containing protein [Microvirga splendida]MBJ6126995.1 PRC-barrel domain-containing protein [Microvirga splendida]
MKLSRITAVLLVTTAFAAPALAQDSNPAVRPALEGRMSHLAPDALYEGWRSQQLIGQKALRRNGEEVGTIRDLIIDADGRLAAVLVTGGGASNVPDFLYRIPWSEVDLTPGREGIATELLDGKRPQYTLFPGTDNVPTLPREFRLTEVLGDYARLQTGYGYGYVTDAVFDMSGRLIAVLVSRDAASGGGTFAFAFPGTVGRWDPGASYYGLPFITDSQAEAAGLRIDPKRFKGAML